jgi:hypothetical protein
MFSTRYSKTGPSSIFQSLVSYSWTSSTNLSIVIRVIHHWKEIFEIDTVRNQQLVDLGCYSTLYTYIYPSPFLLPFRLLTLPSSPPVFFVCYKMHSLPKHALSGKRNMHSLYAVYLKIGAVGSETCALSLHFVTVGDVGIGLVRVSELKLRAYEALSY